MADIQPDSSAEELALQGACSRLWGEHWAIPLSDLTGIAPRTCKRVRASILAGIPDPRAIGLLAALRQSLEEIQAGVSVGAGPSVRSNSR